MCSSIVRTTEVHHHANSQVTVRGWIHSLRKLGRVAFVTVRDGYGTVQVVANRQEVASLADLRAGPESVVRVTAIATANPQAPGGVELTAPVFEVLVAVNEPLPVPHGLAGAHAKLPAILDHAPTALRDPRRRAVVRIAAAAAEGFRSTLRTSGFTEIHTPKIVSAATESGANVFALDYFGAPAYLAQSPQLYKQIMVGVFERVFEVGPVFRAEPHATVRHLSQYTSLDAELGFITDHRDVIAVAQNTICGMVEHLRRECERELAELEVELPRLPAEFPTVDFTAARRLLDAAGLGASEDLDLAPADERWLHTWAQREFESDVLVVIGYPLAKRPFYTHPDPHRPAASHSFDVLFRGTELVTGGQRLHRYEDVGEAIDRAGLKRASFAGYLEAFQFGMPPHGGFAIGLERFVAQLSGLPNVRQATAFARYAGRTQP